MTEKETRKINQLRKQYTIVPESKIDVLKKLDKKVMKPVNVNNVILATIGFLFLGIGMCVTFDGADQYYMIGIGMGIIGIIILSVAYPIYKAFRKHRKKKFSAQILALSDEILNNK